MRYQELSGGESWELMCWCCWSTGGEIEEEGGGVHYKFGHIWRLVAAMTSCAVAADVTAVFRRGAE